MQFHDFIELGIKAIFVMHKLLPNLSTYIHNMAYVSDCMCKCVGVSLRHSVKSLATGTAACLSRVQQGK